MVRVFVPLSPTQELRLDFLTQEPLAPTQESTQKLHLPRFVDTGTACAKGKGRREKRLI